MKHNRATRFPRYRSTVAAATATLMAVAGISGVGLALSGATSAAAETTTSAVKINAGGPGIAGWSADSASSPSDYLSAGQPAEVSSTTAAIDMTDPSVPAGTPQAVFQTERWTAGAALGYTIPTPAGSETVHVYFAENYAPAEAVGARLMDVSINGVNVEHNLDVFQQVGALKGLVRTYTVQSAGGIAVSLTNPQNTNSAHVMAVEVDSATQPPTTQPPYDAAACESAAGVGDHVESGRGCGGCGGCCSGR